MTPSAVETHYFPAGWESLLASPEWLVGVGACLALAVVIAGYCSLREARGLRRRGWGWLFAPRLVALAGLALAVVGLEKRDAEQKTDPSRVVLLVDASASMGLPQNGDESTRSNAAERALGAVSEALEPLHTVRRAAFGQTLRYESESDFNMEPVDQATSLGDALRRVLKDHAAQPLASVVVLSDGGSNEGIDPVLPAEEAAERGVLLHTIGFGPLTEPINASLLDLTAPSRVFSRDPFGVSVAVSATGEAASLDHAVELRLFPAGEEGAEPIVEKQLVAQPAEGKRIASVTTELEPPPPGKYRIVARVVGVAEDSNPDDDMRTTEIEVIDRPTRVLLVAGGPSRDFRFLSAQLQRDQAFSLKQILQTATEGPLDELTLEAFPESFEELEEYDAVVAFDADWLTIGRTAQDAVRRWVGERGGALVFAAGGVHTPEWVRRESDSPLATLLPVELRDDPLAATLSVGAAAEVRPVVLTDEGRRAEFLRLGDAADGEAWSRLEGFYLDPLPADPRLGSMIYARLGEEPTSAPLLAERLYGAGRVVYLAAAQTWRLRSIDTEWFNALHTKLLRHATQGRLLGAETQGSLYFDRAEYGVGDRMTLRLVLRRQNEEIAPPVVEWGAPDGATESRSMASDSDQPGVFTAITEAIEAGRHDAKVLLGAEGTATELSASAMVSLPSRESSTTVRNEGLLRTLAEASGGTYWDDAEAALSEIAAATPSRAEVRTLLGPPDPRFGLRISRLALGMVVGGLMLEWVLRRLWRLA